jgi:nitroimidazol reductase NimA-like FMN-containing flavoprotein (pyridoxamine 5'-phosphate oxidase superfamily)
MDTKELNDELAQPGAQAMLQSSASCHLAYLGPDGLPRVIPVGFLWKNNRVIVCTATTAPKVRSLENRPDVALTIDGGDEPGSAQSLSIRGRATLETVDGVADDYLEMAGKSWDEETRAEFEQQVRTVYEQMVRISIEPRWARFYDFGAGRRPGFLAELTSNR